MKRHFGVTTVARAKTNAEKALVARRAMSRIRRLCGQALAAKTPANSESSLAALRVSVAGFLNAAQ
jgi:hypothetical protein